MLTILIGFFIFLLGIIIGSFLNCVIYRLEVQESFVKGRSYCPHCKHNLIWLDLFPVLSFIFLGGKCKYCKKSISMQYPLVELATGLIFLLIFNFQVNIIEGFSLIQAINLFFAFYMASALIIIFVYDLKYFLIPDKVLFPAIIIGILYRLVGSLLGWFGFWNFILAACIAAGFFLAIFVVSNGRWMGFGDVKLAILLGLILGIPNILAGLFLSFFFGAIIGVVLILLSKKGLKSEVPFAPFLIAGTAVAAGFGGQIIQWYTHFLIF